MIATSIDKLIDDFMYPILTKSIGTPSYKTIKTLNDELTANTYGIQANSGCGTIGFSHHSLTPVVYATMSVVEWVPPLNLGIQSVIPVGSTAI